MSYGPLCFFIPFCSHLGFILDTPADNSMFLKASLAVDVDSRFIQMAALGRPLYPGMLYDWRSHSFIPGVRLWDMTKLNEGLDVHHQPKTHLKFASSDTFQDKSSLLDINASLKASFLGGSLEVGGSAKYLHDAKSSEQQCRVTMQYSQTTTFEQLTITELGNIIYPQVFEQKTATHVVTAVLYGAQAYMLFDYAAEDHEMKQEVDGQLDVIVKKIPSLNIDGKGGVNLTENEKNMAEKITVTFYGDYELEQNPTTYKEAIEVYKKLPSLLKKENNHLSQSHVPLTVWLYPLMLLNDTTAKLEEEISTRLVDDISDVLEELGEVERRCNDLVKKQTTDNFPDVKNRLVKFMKLHRNYKKLFQEELSTALQYQSETPGTELLESILSKHEASHFTISKMNKWLEDITTELNILTSYTNELKDLTVVTSSGSLNSILFNPTIDVVYCLSFTSLNYKDSYLKALEQTVKSNRFTNLGQGNVTSRQATQPWFTIPDISKRMRENLLKFTSFFKDHKNENRTRFIIASVSDEKNPGSSIRKYKNGLQIQSDLAADDDSWTVTKASYARTTHVTLTELKPEDQSWLRYRSVHKSLLMSSLYHELRTKIMTNMGMSRWSLSNIKSEVTNFVNNPRTPYFGIIPGGLRAGMALYFQGVVSATGCRFNLNLATGLTVEDDIAFHFNPRINNSVVQNSRRDGEWRNEERISENPFSKGSAFDIFIVTKTEGYEVYVNGQRLSLYIHRIPVEKVVSLHILDDVIINTFGIVKNWSISTFGKELSSGISRTKLSNIQSDVPQPVCSPSNPYVRSIPGGLRPVVALFFQGVVPSDGERFEINLETGLTYLHDIALHFNPRMHSVVLNSRRNGTWENYIETAGGPFVKGGAFDIIMVITTEGYEVMVNGLHYCTFRHRIPVNKVTTLSIKGDVFMNTFRTFEVPDF